jgi:hypothetical protein
VHEYPNQLKCGQSFVLLRGGGIEPPSTIQCAVPHTATKFGQCTRHFDKNMVFRTLGHGDCVRTIQRPILRRRAVRSQRQDLHRVEQGARVHLFWIIRSLNIMATKNKPLWDPKERQLWFTTHDGQWDELQVEYRWPSPNQTRIIQAFHRRGWPKHIRDPLPRDPDVCPKRRLHDTIKCLNRRTTAIKFRGDGTGKGIYWEQTGA